PTTLVDLGEQPAIARPAPKAAPVASNALGPIAVLEDPHTEQPPVTRPVVEAPAPPKKRGLFSASLHSLHRMENKMLGWAGKDDASVTWEKTIQQISDLEPKMQALSDAQLRGLTDQFKARLKAPDGLNEEQSLKFQRKAIEEVLPEAFAAVREAAVRTQGIRPYDVQMLGGIVMAHGQIAEMGTGEGKTLAAVAPVYLHALLGKGAHVITVNETLAQRDAGLNTPIFKALGMNVGVVLNDMSADAKRQGYNADVTYLTNSTLGFDFLRDNMARRPEDLVQRAPQFALVDEVDEILIDEARTPLIIAQSTDPSTDMCDRYSKLVDQLKPGEDFEVDYKKRTVALTDKGTDKVQKLVGLDLWASSDVKDIDASVRKAQAEGRPVTVEFGSRDEACAYIDLLKTQKRGYIESKTACGHDVTVVGVTYPEAGPARKARPAQDNALILKSAAFNHMDQIPYLDSALKARTLFQRDKDYVVQERPEWSEQRDMAKLHKLFESLPAVEQNGVQQEAQKRTQATLASVLAGADVASCPLKDWWDIVDPKPDQVPDTVLSAQFDADGLAIMGEKFKALPADRKAAIEADVQKEMGNDPKSRVNIVDEFTGRVLPGRRYAQGLHQAIEAKEHVEVQPDTETMASITYPNLFRQYPQLAGMSGTAKTEEEELKQLYGLAVGVIPPNKPSQRQDLDDQIYMTRADKYRALVDQVEKLHSEGQSVLVGTRSIEVNEELARICKQRGLPFNLLNAESVKNNTSAENDIIAHAGKSGAITIATNMAGRGVDIKPDRFNFMTLTKMASDVLIQSAMDARMKALEGQFSKLPVDRQAAINQAVEAEVKADFRTQQCNALVKKLSDKDADALRQKAGDPAQLGLETYRQNLIRGLEQKVDALPAPQRDALAGAQPSDDTRRTMRAVVLTRELGVDANISYQEGDRGVAISFEQLKPAKVLEQVGKMATWLSEQGIPFSFAEPGIKPEALERGKVTLIYPGASQAAPAVAIPQSPSAPAFIQPGPTQPGTIIQSADHPGQGLYVIGSERHESLRIDRQLCGRSGRQGDPGTTRFFLSMDDELMRFFGGDSLKSLVQRMGMQPGESISNKTVSNAIRKAQKAVEARDFDQRTNTTKYDVVLNQQRLCIYKDRMAVLKGEDMSDEVRDWADEWVDDLAKEFKGSHDKIGSDDAVALAEQVKENFGIKVDTDGGKGYKATVDGIRKAVQGALDQRLQAVGKDGVRDAFLHNLDDLWHVHLDEMSELQSGIGWVAAAQKNPEVEYKIQAGHMFEDMTTTLKHCVIDDLLKPEENPAA
ncbi:MAG TPA: hypothetical protein VGO93_05490, partial [Candidatus Xenobia bacterium]